MKKVTMMVMILTMLVGCGGGGGGGITQAVMPVNNDITPSISNLSISPTVIPYNSGGGSVTVNGTFDFIDLDGDLIWISYYNVNSPNQVVTSRLEDNVSGVKTGTIGFSVMGSSTQKGTFTYRLYVSDSKWNNSNGLSATVVVR